MNSYDTHTHGQREKPKAVSVEIFNANNSPIFYSIKYILFDLIEEFKRMLRCTVSYNTPILKMFPYPLTHWALLPQKLTYYRSQSKDTQTFVLCAVPVCLTGGFLKEQVYVTGVRVRSNVFQNRSIHNVWIKSGQTSHR